VLERDYDLDALAAKNLLDFLREQQEATRVVPSDRTIVIERFRDEIGDWRLCILSPYGGRIHSAWALALSARIRDEFGLESDAIWSDDGIIVHLPDADEPPGASSCSSSPTSSRTSVVGELGGSALFGARFRENASRLAAHPARLPGKRTPLWQQRLKSQSLLEVAKRYGDFPVILETYRECLRDVSTSRPAGAPARRCTRELSLVEVETPDRVAVRLVAALRLRRDVHVRGRHARTPSGAPPPCRSTATCCASCSARRSCATSSTPTRCSRSRTTCSTARRARGRDARRA
jgi:ATP-dependent Lhr-like helicase